MLDTLVAHLSQDRITPVLAPPALKDRIAHAADILGVDFPAALIDLYRTADGETFSRAEQLKGSSPLFVDFEFISIDEAVRLHETMMNDLEFLGASDQYPDVVGLPLGTVRDTVFHCGWIPFGRGPASAHLAIDTAPGPRGSVGQVIVFGTEMLPNVLKVAEDLPDLIHQVDLFFQEECALKSQDPGGQSLLSVWEHRLLPFDEGG